MPGPTEPSSFLPSRETANAFRTGSSKETCTRGEFRAQAFWILERLGSPDDAQTEKADPGNAATEDSHVADILGAIAEEVERHCALVCASISIYFSCRISHARATLPRNQVAGTAEALRQAMKAALRAAREFAKAELKARQAAAMVLYRRSRMRPIRNHRDPSPWRGPKQ
jgi:hypothetical protein